jgi:aryl-alcohol dehydrogenase-like predicted oxidoreductase
MKKRYLGNIEVSEIGMGCMGLSHGYGEITEKDYSIEAIRKAYEYGCTFFDTAEGYGAMLYGEGHNEKLLGEAAEPFRKKVVLATKFHFTGELPETDAQIEDYIRRHLAQSMKNLRTSVIDLYYLHRVHPKVSVEKTAAVMGKLIDEGLINGWGLSQVDADTLKKAHAVTPVSAVQNLYNMLERDCDAEIFPFCMENNIGVVPFSPVASGFLSGKVTAQTSFEHIDDVRKFVPQLSQENMAANQPILDLLTAFAEKKNATKAQISMAWMLKKYPNVVPIPGSKNQERILENLRASEIELSDDEFRTLQEELDKIPVHGHRGNVEYDGSKMSDWGKKKE